MAENIEERIPAKFSFVEIIRNWYQEFFSDAGLKVAIARKGPRMVEFCREKGWEIGNRAEGYISEHALPFLDLGVFQSIHIADDAVYYGSTFERIYSCILTKVAMEGRKLPRGRILGKPAVLSVDAKRFLPIKDCLGAYAPGTIDKDGIPCYINSIITEFQHLGKPYDVEFPLLYFRFPEKVSPEKMSDFVFKFKSALDKRAVIDEPYRLRHLYGGSEFMEENWTLLLNNLIPGNQYRVKPEFRKLRFFVKENRLCVASFAPHILTDSMLSADTPLFRDTPLAPLWKRVWEAAFLPLAVQRAYRPEYADYVLHPSDDQRMLEIRWNEQVKDYLYHRSCSLLIWANYLLSFALLLDVEKEMAEALEASGLEASECWFGTDDLALLVGGELADELAGALQNLYKKRESIVLPAVRIEPVSQYEVLPEKFSDYFLYHNRLEFAKCESVSELLSCNYSNQHRFLELATRKEFVSSFDRLYFGESFTSMQQKAELYFSDSSVRLHLHQGMDERIDMGSVVPKYVRLNGYADAPWLRLFRAGENEDKYKDQLHRVIWMILSELAKEYKSVVLPQELILACFNFIAGNLAGEEAFHHLLGINFRVRYDYENGYYRTFFLNETDDKEQERDLLKYAADYVFLIEEEKSEGFWRLNRTEYTAYLEGGNTLNDRTNRLVLDYVKAAHLLAWHAGVEGIREIYNWLVEQEYDWFVSSLDLWEEERFLPALENESPEGVLDAKHFLYLNGVNILREQFPSEFDYETARRDVEANLGGESEAASLIRRLFGRIDRRIGEMKENPRFKEVDTRIDICHALAFLAIAKFVLKNPDYLTDEFDTMIAALHPLEGTALLTGWLEQMKDRDFFMQEEYETVKKQIQAILEFW